MKIIFLDFDGVLNAWDEMDDNVTTNVGIFSELYLSRKLVARLNKIIEATDAVVVVSSTWRQGNTPEDLQDCLDQAGFKGLVIDKTPKLYTRRGLEIDKWLTTPENTAEDPVESFIILDDGNDMEHLTNRLILTNMRHGLLDIHVDKAIKMLNE